MRHIVILCTVAIALSIRAGDPSAQQTTRAPAVSPELFAAQAKPGDSHARLAALVGSWTFTMRYEAGPRGKGEETGTLVVRPAMGGRFYIEEAKTRFFGQPFEWVGIHGYDTQSRQYVSSWIDNLSTQIDHMTGSWNEATRTLTYTGEEAHPVQGKATVEWAMTIESARLRIEMFQGAGAARKRVMELEARK